MFNDNGNILNYVKNLENIFILFFLLIIDYYLS